MKKACGSFPPLVSNMLPNNLLLSLAGNLTAASVRLTYRKRTMEPSLLTLAPLSTIPTPTGTMQINDVYFCEGIKGSILLTGRLLESGWSILHEGLLALLVDPIGCRFDCSY
ncbi:putative signal peptide protein, partial [Puccinia sorghi]